MGMKDPVHNPPPCPRALTKLRDWGGTFQACGEHRDNIRATFEPLDGDAGSEGDNGARVSGDVT